MAKTTINFGRIVGRDGKDGAPGKDGKDADVSKLATKEELQGVDDRLKNVESELNGVTALANEINGEVI